MFDPEKQDKDHEKHNKTEDRSSDDCVETSSSYANDEDDDHYRDQYGYQVVLSEALVWGGRIE